MDYINVNEIVGKNIQKQLLEKNISMAELGRAIGVSAATVSNWCSGKKSPRMGRVDQLCQYFNCKRSDLLEGVSSDSLDALEEDIIKRFRALPNSKKITAYKSIDDILKYLEA